MAPESPPILPIKPGLIPPAADRAPQFPVMPKLFSASLPKTSPLIDRSQLNPTIEMYGNDTLSDCTSAAIANGINALSAIIYPDNPRARRVITKANAVYFYSLSTGYNPADATTDKGGDADTVAKYVSRYGYPCYTEYLYPVVGELEPTSILSLQHGLDAFGVLNLGVGLSLTDQTNKVWDVGMTADAQMGTWGWHMVNLWDYQGFKEDDQVTLLSFGQFKKATWRWVLERTVLTYGHAYHQMVIDGGPTFDHEGWAQYIQQCKDCSSPV